MQKQGLRLSLVQDQRLKMNQQMLQSLKLMELPLMDLRERIEQELESNPALEIIEDNSTVPLDETETQRKDEDEYYEISSGRGNELSEEHRRFIEGALSRPETLQEHLLRQIQLEPIDDELRFIAETLIQNLDDDGFHKEEPVTLFELPQRRMQEAMDLVRELDPAGTCTSDYRESLRVQISLIQEIPQALLDNEEIIEIMFDNLELVEREKYSVLAKKIDLDEEETCVICNFLKTLSPFPGRAYESASSEVRYVIPDIKVVREKDEFSINLNDEIFPVLGTNSFFEKMGKSKDQSTKNFAREKIKEARLFINHLSQRNKTLIRVANAILEFQRSFFINGPKYLSPLTLGDIAKELQIHETTVSRTANGKYMQTEWGIFEIRYFFTNSISEGSQYSKESVKEMIKEIVTAENRLLSDQEISALLNQKGIALARRTVAKYRKELDMGSSYTRKVKSGLIREKNSGGSK